MWKFRFLTVFLVLTLTVTGCLPSTPTEIPPQPGKNSAPINGSQGTPPGGIPVICDSATGSVSIPSDSFSGDLTISIQCVSPTDIQSLETLVAQQTGSTSEFYGAITLMPSPFQFNKLLTLVIPLVNQATPLAVLTVYYLIPPSQLGQIDDATVSEDGWTATASKIDHFSTFVVAGPPPQAATEAPTTEPNPLATIVPTLVPTTIPIIVTPQSSTCQTPSPEEFVRCYFTAVWQERDYEYLWTLLTDNFKNATNPGGYDQYTQWGKSIDRVDISDVIVSMPSSVHANVQVQLTFHMMDGSIIPNTTYSYFLSWNDQQQTWQFDLPGNVNVTFHQTGALATPGVERSLTYAIDWKTVFSQQAANGQAVDVYIDGQQYNALSDFFYDPSKASSILGDTVFAKGGFTINLLYPTEDPEFGDSAKMIAGNLKQLNINVNPQPVPSSQIKDVAATQAAAGYNIISFSH